MKKVDLPVYSTKTLIQASLAAILVAGMVVVMAVLPAEYGIDPTGVGELLGLKGFTLSEARRVAQANGSVTEQLAFRQDRITLEIPVGEELSYKLFLNKHGSMRYAWRTDKGRIFFDFHGEPQGAEAGYVVSYTVSVARIITGQFYASFAGSHGWRWINLTDEPITVTLETAGYYNVIGMVK